MTTCEDARVLDRDAGHRAELVERGDVVLGEARCRVPAEADRADHAVLAADGRQSSFTVRAVVLGVSR